MHCGVAVETIRFAQLIRYFGGADIKCLPYAGNHVVIAQRTAF
jgi:hypothetical protein